VQRRFEKKKSRKAEQKRKKKKNVEPLKKKKPGASLAKRVTRGYTRARCAVRKKKTEHETKKARKKRLVGVMEVAQKSSYK
jgi:hypothetical protein